MPSGGSFKVVSFAEGKRGVQKTKYELKVASFVVTLHYNNECTKLNCPLPPPLKDQDDPDQMWTIQGPGLVSFAIKCPSQRTFGAPSQFSKMKIVFFTKDNKLFSIT